MEEWPLQVYLLFYCFSTGESNINASFTEQCF